MPLIPTRLQAFNHRPFAGGRGVSLYLAVGSGLGIDPGAEKIKFRSLRIIPQPRKNQHKKGPVFVRGSSFDYGNGVRKTAGVAIVISFARGGVS